MRPTIIRKPHSGQTKPIRAVGEAAKRPDYLGSRKAARRQALEVERNAAAAGWPVITRVEEFHADDAERIFVIRSTPAPQPQSKEGLENLAPLE
jgi:hypothetical protein